MTQSAKEKTAPPKNNALQALSPQERALHEKFVLAPLRTLIARMERELRDPALSGLAREMIEAELSRCKRRLEQNEVNPSGATFKEKQFAPLTDDWGKQRSGTC